MPRRNVRVVNAFLAGLGRGPGEVNPNPPPPLPRRLKFDYELGRYRYIDEDTGLFTDEELPIEVHPYTAKPLLTKKKAVAQPNGRMRNVRLQDLMKVYQYMKYKLVDFRIPMQGEWILAKSGNIEGIKVVKCTTAGFREPRLIFEVME